MTRKLLRKTPDVFALITLAEIFALGQLNCRVLETMLILSKCFIKIPTSLDPCKISRLYA